jgi:two-component system, sensor histidine kinase LadS
MVYMFCFWRWIGLLGLMLVVNAVSPALAQQESASGYRVLPQIMLSSTEGRISLAGHAYVWLDSSGSANVQQAQEAFQQPQSFGIHERKDGVNYRLHGQAMWLQFTAHNLHAAGHWRLQVGLPTTDLATLYYQRADGSWIEQSGGDSLPHGQWAMSDRYPLFALSDMTGQPITYLLRIVHDRVPYSADIVIATDEAILASRQLENLILGVYFGMMLTVMIVCIAYGLALRYANYYRYAVYVGALGWAQLSFLGLGAQYLTPGWVHWNSVASFVLPYASVAVALWLVRALTQPAQFAPWLDRCLMILCGFMGFMAVFDAAKPSLAGFRIANAAMLASMVSLYVLLWLCSRAGDRNARWIALGFSPVVLAAMFPVLRNFGVGSTGFLSQYAVTIGSAIEVPLLMYALMLRSANQRDMRVREQALLQQDALTGLPNERRFVSKLHSSILRARRYRHKLGLLHVRLQNHDHLVKEFGSQVAHAALLLTASHLRSVSRDIDLPARLQGEEFVLLMEGPATPARLIEAATQLLAYSLRPSEALPVGTQPRLMICAALLPDDVADSLGEDANTAYQWLLSQSECRTDDSPRKAIRSINF